MSTESRFDQIINETKAAIDNAVNEAKKDIEQIRKDFTDTKDKIEAVREKSRQNIDAIVQRAVEQSREIAAKNREQLHDAKDYIEAAKAEYKNTGSIDRAVQAVKMLYMNKKSTK